MFLITVEAAAWRPISFVHFLQLLIREQLHPSSAAEDLFITWIGQKYLKNFFFALLLSFAIKIVGVVKKTS